MKEEESAHFLRPDDLCAERVAPEADPELEVDVPELDSSPSFVRREDTLQGREVGGNGANLTEVGKEVACEAVVNLAALTRMKRTRRKRREASEGSCRLRRRRRARPRTT